ncbi:uncharacterized protein IUM83_05498 [Phytophthora cinnamomi]|uniref:uncharacterized protein n=1 Tax=Phytophthora cinnamomi TaxID=4785 RepID=UPI00355951D5|nr:hypothetical protein IUM83_07286 [Phytophthora cinnamomi]KAG6622437.1 hypothetical protein IUM83_05498 [Phytophthora cinnamomi]
MMRHRKCVAEFLIRQASVLPYDCATEMDIPAIPELVSPPPIHIPSTQPSTQLHFVQVTWNTGELTLTFEQLEEMFGKFGEIENLGINEQGNRAIVAYVNAESAEEAEHTMIPNIRIRRRKPRQSEKRHEHSPKHSKTTYNSCLQGDATEVLQSKLLDMETILRTSSAALSATKLSNEFERAVLQLHQQILDMVEECLILAGARSGETADSLATKASANAEFLDFLEAQARTQVKILEVEVRAGQELLRLHKTQYENERVELEEEITALRIGRTETERLCTELRTDLRKCRSELACHIANATDIQRQKSALEEKLETSDNQLHVKGIALAKLQAEYDKMHRVAAEAQMRVEKFKRGEFDESMDNQIEHKLALLPASNYEKRVTRTRVSEDLPHTTKLFSKLSQLSTNKEIPEDPNPPTKPRVLDTSTISSRPSNVAALEAMKQQMTQDIQDQIASTKAALREMEVCSASGKTLEEEEEELRQLQQQLTARSSEMAAAMNESRHKLQELLDPTAASSFSGADQDSMAPNQEPTIFDSTALVNELIARAENAPPYNATRCAKAPIADSSDTQSLIVGVGCGQQFIEFHRPTRDAQSFLYKKWTSDRSRKIAQLATYRDQQAVIQAQQSMQAFQQTLAEFRNQR